MEDLFNKNIYIFFILINKYSNQHTKLGYSVCLINFSSTSYSNRPNRIGGTMVSLFTTNSVNRGFDPGRVKLRTNTLIVVASALSIHHQEKRTKTGWL